MWIYKNKELNEIPEGYVGFVYIIKNKLSGRQYIGKKLFQFAKTKQVKGKKKHYKAESNWKEYWGSNDLLQKDIEYYGADNFKRKILRLCKNKAECSYYEAKAQFDHDVLLQPHFFYNSWISVRVTSAHLKHLETDIESIINR